MAIESQQEIHSSLTPAAAGDHPKSQLVRRSLLLREQGVKLGDLQATVMGMLSAALFFVISHAKPLEHMSADRPHTMIFSVYVFASITGQFVVHMAYLVIMYNGALSAMPEVSRFYALAMPT